MTVPASPRGTRCVPEAGWWSSVVLGTSTLWDNACCSRSKSLYLTSGFSGPIPLAVGEGIIRAAAGVVQTTPVNKAKRSVAWVSTECATTEWESACGESYPQVADGDRGEQALLSCCRGVAPSRSLVSWCCGQGLSSCHAGRSSLETKGIWAWVDTTDTCESADTVSVGWSVCRVCRNWDGWLSS